MMCHEKPHSVAAFYFMTGISRANENHEQGIIVNSRLIMQRMRIMPVLTWRRAVFQLLIGQDSCLEEHQR